MHAQYFWNMSFAIKRLTKDALCDGMRRDAFDDTDDVENMLLFVDNPRMSQNTLVSIIYIYIY